MDGRLGEHLSKGYQCESVVGYCPDDQCHNVRNSVDLPGVRHQRPNILDKDNYIDQVAQIICSDIRPQESTNCSSL